MPGVIGTLDSSGGRTSVTLECEDSPRASLDEVSRPCGQISMQYLGLPESRTGVGNVVTCRVFLRAKWLRNVGPLYVGSFSGMVGNLFHMSSSLVFFHGPI